MVTASSRPGLIVSTSTQATAALDELIACCRWPALRQANTKCLRRELLLDVPKLSLFWLDDPGDVASTAELLTWLGTYQPSVRRVAVGYRLTADVEVAIRSAGVHWYVAADGNIRELLDGSIRQLLSGPGCRAAEPSEPSFALDLHGGVPAADSGAFHLSNPP